MLNEKIIRRKSNPLTLLLICCAFTGSQEPIGRSVGFRECWSFRHFSASLFAVLFNEPYRISLTVSSNKDTASKMASWWPIFATPNSNRSLYLAANNWWPVAKRSSSFMAFLSDGSILTKSFKNYKKAIPCTYRALHRDPSTSCRFHPDSTPISGQDFSSEKVTLGYFFVSIFQREK